MTRTRTDASSTFAIGALVLAGLAAVVAVLTATGTFDAERSRAEPGAVTQARDNAIADRSARAPDIVAAAADAMATVTSVEFRLARDGAPIYIDEFGRIALDGVRGQFTIPTRAQAQLDVTVEDNLATRLGAVAIDDEVWISNPVTGDFETLPDGYDIDPSRFFDPEGGWRPLLANLTEPALLGIEDRGGERYVIRGVAPAAQVRELTVGLVRDQDVTIQLWVHPDTWLVTAAEFDTAINGETAHWELELSRYGDTFLIEPPTNVRARAP